MDIRDDGTMVEIGDDGIIVEIGDHASWVETGHGASLGRLRMMHLGWRLGMLHPVRGCG